MAFVIHSAKALTQSKVRAINIRTFWAGATALILLTLAGGVWLGYSLAGSSPADAPEPLTAMEVTSEPVLVVDEAPEGRFLIDRLGELSGRMFRLESEAATLAKRINIIDAFEKRLKKPIPADKTPAEGASLGGPLIAPVAGQLEAAIESGSPELALETLESQIDQLDAMLESIDEAAAERKLSHMLFPSREPVKDARRSSRFGNRFDPFNGRKAFHSGLDFSAPYGTPIYAAAGGKVTLAGWHREYGNKVEIDHGNGVVSRYAHASKLFVKTGDVVSPGQRIANVGSTGRSTGPHLHFEILESGHFVNPSHYLVGSATP
ncbi:MAG: M23 family metallopeptidase [Rhodocyclaceae bacterium]|nr:M23 family metallopeptidase [Rhodocyclaceae bacterium]